MAGFVSLGTYDGSLRIPEFKGLNQYGDGIGTDPRYAVEAVNALTTEGVLRPVAACRMLDGALPLPISTIAMLHRRWYTTDNEHDVLIGACNGQLYWTLPSVNEWHKIDLPDGWHQEYYDSDDWSCVSYEINPDDGSADEAPIDVLLMSNAKDGMICIRGDNLTASIVPTPKKFGVIARHAERIWGGAIENDPDMLVYSAPFDPFNWAQNDEIPEDGAGDIMQPSWDGDSFTALTSFGNQLIALKRTRVWRVYGTNPGEYVFSEQFGGGTQYARTLAVDGTRMLMLGRDGLVQYNGESVAPYYQDYARGVFGRMNREAMEQAVGCIYKDTYYCALPLDGSRVCNAVLMFNTIEKTWLVREDVRVESFLPTENALYFTSAETPGRVWLWQDDSWLTGQAQPMRWVSPWQDFGYQNMSKGGFTLYLTAECKEPVALLVGVQTEKKLKVKSVLLHPPEEGQNAKHRRVSFGGSGRRFRLLIESKGGAPWRLLGGLQLEAETDLD